METTRHHVTIGPKPRGVHLVTREIEPALELGGVGTGLAHLFLQHTSAGLLLTENASPDVRGDLERWLRDAVPDGWRGFRHVAEGPDDMPAHVGSALLGASLAIPVRDGRLALGTWQGIALAELREEGGARRIEATVLRD